MACANRNNPAETKERLKARGICVIIPTYNNHASIKGVVEDVSQYCDDIIVVNDGSTDTTGSILQEIPNITLIEYERNRGKGYALKSGFRRAKEIGFAYAITIDADGQHYAKDIPAFLNANIEHPGAIIIGERDLSKVERSKGSRFANNFSNFWFLIQTWRRIKDTQSGYRLYPIKKHIGIPILTARYEAELELLVFGSWHDVKIHTIPIESYYPPKNERVSHFRPYRDFARIFILNTILCIMALIYGLPLLLWRLLMTILRTLYSLITFLIASLIVVTPYTFIYLKLCRGEEKRMKFTHSVIYSVARFVLLRHGIPGTKFRYDVHKGVNFEKPSIIICNHQSHLDLFCQLIFTPKIIFFTNDWVWKNPFYGFLIRSAEYLPINEGIEPLMPKIESLVKRGYSIAIYPEGTRSRDGNIGRFHQGAFYIAEKLNLDITPMFIYGTSRVLPLKALYMRKGSINIYVDSAFTREMLDQIGEARKEASEIHKLYVKRYDMLKDRLDQYA